MKHTKQAFVRSVIALVLCVSMFVGTTFAWFTDSVTSMNNLIQTGILDVELEWLNHDGQWEPVTEQTNVFEEDALWEPGHTEVVYLRVINKGSLALKYQLGINVVSQTLGTNVDGEAFMLSDYIEMGAVDATTAYATREAARDAVTTSGTLSSGYTTSGSMSAGAADQYLALVVYMPEEVGNVANYKTGTTPPTINLGITLLATQMTEESDSIGPDYDANAQFPTLMPGSVTVEVTPDVNGILTEDVTVISSTGALEATIPAGTKVAEGVTALTLSVSEMTASGTNITLQENEILRSMDVHIEGLAEDNTVPAIITVKEAMMIGLNMGNYALYHVENDAPVTMTYVDSVAALDAHNQFCYDPATGDVTLAMASFSEVAAVADTTKAWEGNFDYSWYTNAVALLVDETVIEYTIANADQLAAFGAIVGGMAKDEDGNAINQDSFSGKTVKLLADINLDDKNNANEGLIFHPIGYYYTDDKNADGTTGDYYSTVNSFEGTFDGNGHTIANFYQNTWEIKGDYDGNYYSDAMGLFGYVVNGKVCNLTVDNFSSDGEFTPTGVIAAYAVNSTFENIAITNCNPRVYNTGNGGIIGIAGSTSAANDDHITLKNITIDNSNIITALWGSWDVACGGLVGMFRGDGHVHMTNCHVAAQMDVYNDVCGNYQYYWYRYSGMMVGTNKNMTTDANGYTVPETDKFHAENCTVHFGDWNDYYYCELVANSLASYTHDHQFSRLTKISSLDEIKSGDTWMKTGNFLLISGDTKTCYHIVKDSDGTLKQHLHTDAGEETVDGETVLKEDKQIVYLPFNQLFTGYGWGVKHIPVYNGEDYTFDGITILDRTTADSVKKFDTAGTAKDSYTTESNVTIGELFKAATIADEKLSIKGDNVQVTVSPFGATSTAGGTYVANTTDWTQGTLTFSGVGQAVIAITDYYFCKTTTITVNIIGADKFDTNFVNYKDYLYRVGNANTVTLGTIFKANDGVAIDSATVEVAFDTVAGNAFGTYTASTSNWTQGTILFTGTGVVKVTISADGAKSFELLLEVVDATNITSAAGTTTGGNFVLLCDVNTTSYVNYWNCTLYGNGFTYSLNGAPTAYNSKQGHGILITKNATLDNLVIVGDVYDSYGAYTNQDYYNAAVDVVGDTVIQNCYISGCAAPVSTRANATITDTTLYGGTVGNLIIKSGTVTLEDVTTANYDDGRSLVGMGIVIHSDATEATKLVLNGTLTQYNFISEANTPSDSNAKMLYNAMFDDSCTAYHFGTSPERYVNAGIISMTENFGKENIEDNANTGYEGSDVTVNNVNGYVYTQLNTSGSVNNDYVKDNDSHIATTQGPVAPSYSFDYTEKNYVAKTDGSNDYCYEENGTVYISIDEGDTFNWDTSILTATKVGQTLSYTVSMNSADYTGKSIAFNAAGAYTVTYSYTDENNYGLDADGNVTTYSKTYTKTVYITVSTVKAAWKNAEIKVTNTAMSGIYVMSGDYDYSYKMKFLDCVTVTDYDEAGNATTVTLSEGIASTSFVDVNGANPGKFDANRGTITITYSSGKVLTVKIGAWSGSGPSTKTCSVKTDDGVYLITDGASNAANTGVTWKITGYTYTGNNGAIVEDNTTITFTWDTNSEGYNSKSSGSCVTPDTLITLADGTQKRIDEVTYADQLLAWDFFKGEYTAVSAAIVFDHGYGNNTVIELKFSDGTSVKVVNLHQFFDADMNKFVSIDADSVADYVGHKFAKKNGNSYEMVTLVDYTVTEQYCEAWGIISAEHYNIFVEDMLSTDFMKEDFSLFNYFEVGKDMMFDKDKMQADIEKYGLYTYEDFAEYLTYEQFMAFNVQYFKIAVGKGEYTFEGILTLIETYLNN